MAANTLASRTTLVLLLAQMLDENQQMCQALLRELEKDEPKTSNRNDGGSVPSKAQPNA